MSKALLKLTELVLGWNVDIMPTPLPEGFLYELCRHVLIRLSKSLAKLTELMLGQKVDTIPSPLPEGFFCEFCLHVLNRPEDPLPVKDESRPWESERYEDWYSHRFYDRAEKNILHDDCLMCKSLFYTIRYYRPDTEGYDVKTVERILHFNISTESYFKILMVGSLLGDIQERNGLSLFSTSAINFPLAALNPPSEVPWELLSGWYNNCTKNHRRCTFLQDKRTKVQKLYTSSDVSLPTRLIDIGPKKSSVARLITTSQVNTTLFSVKYTTLSHRWGTGSPVKLLNDNIKRMEKEIPLELLSQTFRDAFEVTRKFGLRYIWIDSLCIIQDSPEDWLKESTLMRDVYKGCELNIAATGASYGPDGLFRARDPQSISLFPITVRRKAFEQQYLCYKTDSRYDGFRDAPLNNRGWVFQERVLSPRTIHFGLEEIWECMETEAGESYPMGFKFPTQKSLFDGMLKYPHARFEGWSSLVEAYSVCDLSFEKDKLVAISGLAKEMRLRTGDEYVCGLWKRDLVRQLAWSIPPQAQPSGNWHYRPLEYRAPSWSWASVVGGVSFSYFSDSYEPLVNIIEVHVAPLGTDDTGEVTDGWIKLEGTLRKFSDIPKDYRKAGVARFMNAAQEAHIKDSSTVREFRIDHWNFWTDLLDTPYPEWDPRFEEHRELRITEALERLFILPLALETERDAAGLILEIADSANATYRRVGLMVEMKDVFPDFDWTKGDLGGNFPREVITIV